MEEHGTVKDELSNVWNGTLKSKKIDVFVNRDIVSIIHYDESNVLLMKYLKQTIIKYFRF